jgi:hypothetical protein
MKNPENGIYRCRWAKEGRSYILSLVDVPGFSVRGAKFEDASAELNDLVAERLGGYESFLEFDPPPPLGASLQSFFRPALYELGYHDLVEDVPQQPKLYEDGYCKLCGCGRGKRTDVSRVILTRPRDDIVGITWRLKAIYSENILEVMGKKTVSALFRNIPVVFQKGKQDRIYYELVPQRAVSLVAARSSTDSNRWLCPKCGSYFFSHRHSEIPGMPVSMVARSEINSWKHQIIPINCGKKDAIGCTRKMLTKLKAEMGLKNLVSHRIAIIDEKDVVRKPTLPLYE